MADEKKLDDKNVTLIGLLGVLLITGIGANILLTPEQIEKTYVCTANNVTGIFDNFSSTYKTAYWIDVDGTARSSVCRNGVWISITEFAKINNINISTILKDGINVNTTLPDEDIKIVNNTVNKIVVDKDMVISVDGNLYEIEYYEKPEKIKEVIKCICDKRTGCLLKECLE